MSRETELHIKLVHAAVTAIESDYRDVYSLVLFADLPFFGKDRPQHIRGFIPDVFAVDVPETIRIIGEAKTPFDFETLRSCRQIQAFLAHLANVPNGVFYLSVPWTYRVRAADVLRSWAEFVEAVNVRRVVASVPL